MAISIANLAQLTSLTLSNPIVIALIVGVVRNILGFLEAKIRDQVAYEKTQLFETLLRDLFVSLGAFFANQDPMMVVSAFEVVVKLIHEAKR